MTEERKIAILAAHGVSVINIDGRYFVEDVYNTGVDLVLLDEIENVYHFLNY